MCGIAGFVGDEEDARRTIERMCDPMRHRGPDDEGYLVADGVALGSRRLSIIDVDGGQQPIYNEDGTVAVVLNGEIYNFRELRRRLESRGHRFQTDTDTECIVHLYEDVGERCVEQLRGMFAFAVWDARRFRLVLARDRVGKKPLSYALTSNGICFASELKGLIEHPSVRREVDPVALHHYLTYQYIPAPWSIYRGVRKLPPAHFLVYENGQPTLSRYWTLSYGEKLTLSDADASVALRELICEATAIRMVSERPLGAFLSGGLDSSLVVAAMVEHSSKPVRTFSVGFDDKRFNELAFARLVARRFSTDHHEIIVRPSAPDILPQLAWHYDEPFGDSSALASYYVAQVAAQEVTVVLNGDGGDESFAGYDRHRANMLASHIGVPATARPGALRLLRTLPEASPGARALLGRARRFLEPLIESSEDRYARWICSFDNEQKRELYSDDMQEAVGHIDSYALVTSAMAARDGLDILDRTLGADIETYLAGDLLVKMDIATMANSLEARSPFLDHKLMEFAASLPTRMKVRGLTSKYLPKKVARGWLPEEVIRRRKRGFGVPLAEWLRGQLRDLARDALTDRTAQDRGYFKAAAVDRLLTEHEGGADHGPRIWALLQFELWHRLFLSNSGPQQ
jgi:asparagine synthase (glutamine-hydrolysing)